MKKIISLITIAAMMLCGIIACETEQGSSQNEVSETQSSVKDGDVITLTLDSQGAKTVGTKQIYLKYNVGYYLDKNCKKEITDESGAIDMPAKSGYVCTGYNADKAGKGQAVITAEGLLDLDAGYTDFKADTTLYAQWEQLTVYEIKYYETKGAMNTNVKTFIESDNVTLNKNISADGYTFLGWFDAASDGREVTGWKAGEKTAAVSLWAYWTANTYTVTLNNDGQTSGTKSVTATFGANLPNITIPTKTGFQFMGYYAEANGVGTKYIDKDGNGCAAWNIAANTTLYADWLENDGHFITYIGADNSDNSANPATFKESQSVTIQNITRTGYDFNGWWTDELGGSKVTGWNAGTYTDDMTLYARWTPFTYTVAYYANGGTGSMLPQSFTYDEAQNLTSCGFTAPTGMKFGMWNTQADGLGVPYTDGQSVSNLTATNNAAIRLYAQWVDKATHIIRYNNIMTADNSFNPISFRESQDILLQDLSLPGWDFNGWWTDELGGTKVTGWNAGTKTDDVTLWARWTIQTYTISYRDQNNNTFTGTMSDYPQSHTYGTETPLVMPTRDYYDFEGWHLQQDCLDESLDAIGADAITANTTLYAKWIPIEYNIIYKNVSDGTNTNQATFTVEDNVALSDIVRTGYTHNGWWTESEGGSKVTGWNAGEKTSDVTVYARWTPNTYTITFNANGGTGDMSSQTMTYDVSVDLRANAFTKDGCVFAGWSLDSKDNLNCAVGFVTNIYHDGESVSNLTDVSGGTVTLYAVWCPRISVGKIVYTDGSFSGEYLSDKTPLGIVFYTDGTHGKIVHLSQQYLAWCLKTADGYKCDPATSTSDGSNNWQIICDAVSDEDVAGNYPAFEYVNGLGSGWYLPAKDELNQIYTNRRIINTALNALSSGGVTVITLLENYIYWSSSSYTDNRAWSQSFSDGYQSNSYKNYSESVRAVRAF